MDPIWDVDKYLRTVMRLVYVGEDRINRRVGMDRCGSGRRIWRAVLGFGGEVGACKGKARQVVEAGVRGRGWEWEWEWE